MAIRASAFRIVLALLLVVSGGRAVTSDALASLTDASASHGEATIAQQASGTQSPAIVGESPVAELAPPCDGGPCPDAAEKANDDCHGTLTHCMPAGVLASSKATALRASARVDLAAAIDRLPDLSQWVLDPPPPRS